MALRAFLPLFLAASALAAEPPMWTVRAGGPGNDFARRVAAFADGSSVIVGLFNRKASFGEGVSLASRGGYDILVARYRADGTLAWARSAGGSGYDEATGVACLRDGTCIVTGYFAGEVVFGRGERNETTVVSGGGYDLFLARYDVDGSLVWARRAGGRGGALGSQVSGFPDGSFVLAAYFSGKATFGPGEARETILESRGDHDVAVAQYAVDGTVIWARSAGAPGRDEATAIVAIGCGGCVVTGVLRGKGVFGAGERGETVLPGAPGQDRFVARYAADGRLVWAKLAGTGGRAGGAGLAAWNDGSCLVTGYFFGTVRFGVGEAGETSLVSGGSSDGFVARFRPDGTLQWAMRAGTGAGTIAGQAVAAFPDRSFALAGSFWGGRARFGPGEGGQITLEPQGRDVFVGRFNQDGSPRWMVRAGGASTAMLVYWIDRASDGSLLACGHFIGGTAEIPAGKAEAEALASAGADDAYLARFPAEP